MTEQATGCPDCAADERALDEWRAEGGPMPKLSCAREHGVPCRDCSVTLTRNPSRRCDECFNTAWRLERGFTVTSFTAYGESDPTDG